VQAFELKLRWYRRSRSDATAACRNGLGADPARAMHYILFTT